MIVTEIALLGLAALAFWLILFRKADRKLPPLVLNKILATVGILMMLSWPTLGIIIRYLLPPPGILFLFLALFILGWILIGAALRPRKSYLKGALLALIAYFLIGFGGTAIGLIVSGEINASELVSGYYLLDPPDLQQVSIASLFWPMQVMYWFGLVGPN